MDDEGDPPPIPAGRRPRIRKRPDSLPFVRLIPNLVTIIGLSAGFSSLRFAMDGRFEMAAALIIFAAVIDGLDGLIARRLRATSAVGAQLDSLSDFVCFGVAPGVLVYLFAMSGDPGFGWIFVLAFLICCGLRLARFNAALGLPEPEGPPRFVGVPAPAGAMLGLLPVFVSLSGLADLRAQTVIVSVHLGLVGSLMISRLPTPSPKRMRVAREHAPWVLLGGAVLVGVLLTRVWLLMVLLCVLYAIAVVGTSMRARAERRQAPSGEE
ncbi:MAG: phosphatidylcholine/phosphatidylserine synthase [Rhodobacteraceae bacterium]|nr:phosphatidylcholine/phosphatidylserine synthase [Paracoccaceae bacterium]